MMNNQMEELMGQLEVAESLEQMVSIEDDIAAMIGKGFLDGHKRTGGAKREDVQRII